MSNIIIIVICGIVMFVTGIVWSLASAQYAFESRKQHLALAVFCEAIIVCTIIYLLAMSHCPLAIALIIAAPMTGMVTLAHKIAKTA